MKDYDVVIVGGGAAGLSAALLLGRSRRRVFVSDTGKTRNAVAQESHSFFTRDGTTPADALESEIECDRSNNSDRDFRKRCGCEFPVLRSVLRCLT